jgi:hypothetical protein
LLYSQNRVKANINLRLSREEQKMARPTKLGLVFKGAEAEEFLQNENGTVFTSEQLAFFRKAKRIYRANRNNF